MEEDEDEVEEVDDGSGDVVEERGQDVYCPGHVVGIFFLSKGTVRKLGPSSILSLSTALSLRQSISTPLRPESLRLGSVFNPIEFLAEVLY